MKTISIFNHKGGVSKTTTTFNLGWALSKKGKRVLLVDADSQCNLTMYALGEERFNIHYSTHSTDNIYTLLEPAFKSQPKLISPANCIEISNNLFLLPGHLDFTENEVQMGISMQLSNAFGTMQNLPGAIYYLIEQTAQKYNIDIVMFDLNPSLSAINQDIFICSDYFIIPTSPDLFSLMSIDSLKRVLVSWEKWALSARSMFSSATYKLPVSTPVFLGYTINDFNLSYGQPQKSFGEFMSQISEKIVHQLVPVLTANNMVFDLAKYQSAYEAMQTSSNKTTNINYNDCFCLAQISNFNKLIALSNKASKPVFELTLEDTAADGQQRTLKWFQFLYDALAERVLELMK